MALGRCDVQAYFIPIIYFTETGSSRNSCDETFQGSSSASEHETQAVIWFINQMRESLKLYVTVHSFGQTLLVPYGYKAGAYPRNHANMVIVSVVSLRHAVFLQMDVAHRAVEAMTRVNGVRYRMQESAKLCTTFSCAFFSTFVS